MKPRIILIFVGFTFLWSLLLVRAAVLQIFPHAKLAQLESKQFQSTITLNSRRGSITDRNGRDLAISTTAYSVYADPKILENKKAIAKKLAGILETPAEIIYHKIKDSKKRFIWLARLQPESVSHQIKELKLKGIKVIEEYKRIYPNESLLAPVLGLVGSEGQGLEGIELSYDHVLQSNKRKVQMKRDARGRPLIEDGLMFTENPEGAEVRLTIDSELQYFVENELRNTIYHFDADQAFGVVMDPKTGEILAMATSPTFDANRAAKMPPELRRNRVITDLFEPGSTMKTFVIANGLKDKMLAPNTRYQTENGLLRIGKKIIREADEHHRWPSLTVTEILAYSSNIGSSKIALQMGSDRLRQGLDMFGFGEKTGIDLPGEAKGILQPLPWGDHLTANISFGHGVSVTPLQVANAFASIASGGMLHKPYIVKSYRDPETMEWKEVTANTAAKRILSSEESAQMRLMLSAVTGEGGTGGNARIEGFPVGGKTGTAQKVNPNGRGYLKGGYISSFAGFVPSNDPRYVIYVVVDHPKKNAYYGSQVAAPLFSKIGSYLVRKDGLAPVLLTEKNFISGKKEVVTTFKPNKIESSSSVAGSNAAGGEVASKNNGITATASGAIIAQDAESKETPQKESIAKMPDLRNLSLREVLRKMSPYKLDLNINGDGRVVETLPASGVDLIENQRVEIILK